MGTATRPSGATELTIINTCLIAIGDTPVNALPTDANDVSDVGLIRLLIENASRDVCEQGYYFNFEAAYEFAPDADGHIILPTTLASWRQSYVPSSVDGGYNTSPLELAERYYDGDRMVYDKTERTNVFTSSVYLDVSWYMPVDEIPNPYRKFVGSSATLAFIVPNDGDPNAIRLAQKDLSDAETQVLKEEVNESGPSMWHSSDVIGGSMLSTYNGPSRYS